MKSVLLSLLFVSATAGAATFESIGTSKLTSKELQNFAKVANRIAKKFGDAGKVEAVSFTRKRGEETINTIKQLNYAKGGLNSDDSGAVSMDGMSPDELAHHLMAVFAGFGNEEAYGEAVSDLAVGLSEIESGDIQFFGTNHADEDGSWQILDIYDAKNKEILFIRIGGFGT